MVTIKELKNAPIDCSSHIAWQRYKEHKDVCEDEISEIPLDIVSNEPVVSCGNKILNTNYYYAHAASKGLSNGIDTERNVYLRESILSSLIRVDNFLRVYSLCLFIRSGYRSKGLQRSIIEDWKKEDDGDDAKTRFSHSLFPPHATAAAFDIEIYDLNKNASLLTKNRDVKGIYPYQKLEEEHISDKQMKIRGNIRLLHNLLTKPYVLNEDEVFVQHPYESWHFSRGDRHAKYFSNLFSHKVIYDTFESGTPCLQ